MQLYVLSQCQLLELEDVAEELLDVAYLIPLGHGWHRRVLKMVLKRQIRSLSASEIRPLVRLCRGILEYNFRLLSPLRDHPQTGCAHLMQNLLGQLETFHLGLPISRLHRRLRLRQMVLPGSFVHQAIRSFGEP